MYLDFFKEAKSPSGAIAFMGVDGFVAGYGRAGERWYINIHFEMRGVGRYFQAIQFNNNAMVALWKSK